MAVDQKLENLLSLALEATPREREKSMMLDVGFDRADREWELILRYSGSLEGLRQRGIRVTELSGGYAIAHVPQAVIPELSALPEIEYIEKPKRLFFSAMQGRTASCMDVLQTAGEERGPDGSKKRPEDVQTAADPSAALLGQGILIAVIDSGVDYTHPDFRDPDGSTRFLAIWDQSVAGNPPPGYDLGTEYTREQIDGALRSGERLPTRDLSGHGTAVLGIAAGNGRASLTGTVTSRFGADRGVAPLAQLLAVKLGSPGPDSFPGTAQLMLALDYVFKKAQETGLPLAVNLSFGNVYGPHNGTGLLETYLAQLAERGRTCICVGTGNEGNTAGHAAGSLKTTGDTQEIELGIAPFESTLNVQLWKSYADEFDVSLVHPAGQVIGPLPESLGPQRYTVGDTELLIFYGKPSPYSVSQEIYFDFLPANDYIDSGIWRFRLTPRRIAQGRYDLWLPQAQTLNAGTRFYAPSVENTLTIPSTARNVIAVGAYDPRRLIYAPFSGRGNPPGQPLPAGALPVKPDLAAPGVDITAPAVGGGYTSVTGTSFAAPFVTGAAAMLMQWGLTEGNDPFLYGEKVRACLQRGARPLPGDGAYPNASVGYGTLCVRDSLPGF